jgi:peptidoglycan/LPS O-acetylase OafA/YrhL
MAVLIGHGAMSQNAPSIFSYLHHLGNLGVRCFFIISGFLITTLIFKEQVSSGKFSLKRFYLRRSIRIFPAAFVLIGVIGALGALGELHLYPGDLLHALSYTMNYHAHRSWWLDHLWSLSVEEQFYLLWPGTIWLLGPRRSLTGAFVVVLLAPIIRLVMWFGFHAGDTAMTKQFQVIADALATGCLLSGYYNRLRAIAWYERLQRSSLYIPLALAILIGANISYLVHPWVFYVFGQTFANLATVACIDWCIVNSASKAEVLNTRIFVYVGTLSYSLYLWQNIFLNPDADGWQYRLPLNLALACVAGVASYYLIERPFLKFKDRTAGFRLHSHRNQIDS